MLVQEVLYNAVGTPLLRQVAAFSTSFKVPGGKEVFSLKESLAVEHYTSVTLCLLPLHA